jgi:hypothetical protein
MPHQKAALFIMTFRNTVRSHITGVATYLLTSQVVPRLRRLVTGL